MSFSAKEFPWICCQNWLCPYPWKIFCYPWIYSGFLESSWTVVKLSIIELLITLNIQESRLNKVIEFEPNNV